jgi:hypothetical protein
MTPGRKAALTTWRRLRANFTDPNGETLLGDIAGGPGQVVVGSAVAVAAGAAGGACIAGTEAIEAPHCAAFSWPGIVSGGAVAFHGANQLADAAKKKKKK